MEKVLFKEEQRFTQWWMWVIMTVILLAVLIPFAYGIYSQEVLGKPYGDNPMSTEGLVIVGTFSVLLIGGIFFFWMRARLKTKITVGGIFVSYPPVMNKWKKFVPAEIKKYEVRKYSAVREFGGYGMKGKKKTGKSYTVSGNTGLQLYFRNGKKLLIGTQKKQAIEYAMEKLMSNRIDSHVDEINTAELERPKFGRKAKKILVILAVEIVIAILILVLVQIFK
ncbi:MAG: hypothetical protein ABFS16_04850 [Bacteroidota bacterium]